MASIFTRSSNKNLSSNSDTSSYTSSSDGNKRKNDKEDPDVKLAREIYHKRSRQVSREKQNNFIRWREEHANVISELYNIVKEEFPDRTPNFTQFSEFLYASSNLNFNLSKIQNRS